MLENLAQYKPARGFYLRGGFWLRVCAFLFILFVVYSLWHGLAGAGFHYEWQWNRVWRHFGRMGPDGFVPGPLCKGLLLTCKITVTGSALAMLFGGVAAMLRLSPWRVCMFFAKTYIALWRGTPLLLQLFFAYFLISPLLPLSPLWIAILALAAFEGAYLAEIFRAGVMGVPSTQWEAALSLGFSFPQVFRLVILPQAWANIQPALVNQGIATLKDSSLVSAIAVADLTMQSQAIIAETFLAFEVWLLAAAIYIVMALLIALPGFWLEQARKWRQY